MTPLVGRRRRETKVFVLLAGLLICRIAAASDSAGWVEDQIQSPTVTLQDQEQSNPSETKVNEVLQATIGRGEIQSYIIALNDRFMDPGPRSRAAKVCLKSCLNLVTWITFLTIIRKPSHAAAH